MVLTNKRPLYTDIFIPGGYPSYTYNPRSHLELESKIGEALQNLCKLVIVTGHTKAGKTVLVQKVLPRESSIWIDGGGVGDENDFWTTILDQLALFQTTEIHSSDGLVSEFKAEGGVEGNILLAKARTDFSSSISSSQSAGKITKREVSAKIAALAELRLRPTPIVIDDFHYLPRDLQGQLVRALKPLIFNGLPVVVIAIPHRRYDALKVEKEMTGRIQPVQIPLWSEAELKFVPDTGLPLLDTSFERSVTDRLARESIGSPHLMQEFCRALCRQKLKQGMYIPGVTLNISSDEVDYIFKDSAETIGRPIFEKLARGPRQRKDRILRALKSGEQVDIYGLVLHGLSHIKPKLITLEYEDLRTAIKEICVPESIPNLQEVSRVLKHMSVIAATDQSSTPVIDFDEQDKRLHVTDPFFAFYLRWGSLTNSDIHEDKISS